jgi:hypothetical protein
MSDLKTFISKVKTEGIAKTNKFAVEFSLPLGMNSGARSYYDSKLQNILLFCDTAQLPGVNISTVPNRTFGELRETPYEKLFDGLPLTFYVDNSLVVKSLFDEWTNVIQNGNNRLFSYYNEYVTDILVTVLDNKGQPRYKMMMYEAYPKTVSPIQLSYDSKEIMKLNVNFVFKYWRKVDIAGDRSQGSYLDKYYKDLQVSLGDITSVDIPMGYFTDFAGFQNVYTTVSESFENARSALYGEVQNVTTGVGQRIKQEAKNKLGQPISIFV